MRIISQDGRYDIPYDAHTILFKTGYSIYLCSPKNINNIISIVKYSTPQKTAKVMKMLHDMYLDCEEFFGGYAMDDGYIQPQFWVKPKVFKFPQDEEVKADNENT